MTAAQPSTSGALLAGLRRRGDETQLTRALASIASADQGFATAFLRLALETASGRPFDVPPNVVVTTEEVSGGDRFDLRFRVAGEWDAIVELKIHAGYGRHQLERYLEALDEVDNAFLCAVTRDVALYGEPPRGADPRWAGSVRWRRLLPDLRRLPVQDPLLEAQWQIFLDVLEEEGSMGFTQPKPELFADFARARLATRHMEEFLRVLVHPLLDALRDVLGGDEQAAPYWKNHRRFSRASHSNTVDVPFRVPATGPWRIRAGLIGWTPPAAFYVSPAPNQRWSRRQFMPEVREAVDKLVAGAFEPEWMTAYLPLTDELILAPDLEEQVVSWAHARFADIRDSSLLTFPVEQLGDARPPDGEDPGTDAAAE